jgi:hypothetical protein
MAPAITHMHLSIAKYVKIKLISPIWSNTKRCSLSIALLFLDWYYFIFWIGNYDLKHHSLKWQIHISWSSSKCFASHRFQLPYSGLNILTIRSKEVVFILFGRWLSIQMHVILLEVGHPAGVITEIQSAVAKFNQNYIKGTKVWTYGCWNSIRCFEFW